MIEIFRSIFAPPRHFIFIVTAIWLGLALAEKRSERHGISKDTLNNLTFYSLIAYVIGGRLLYAIANLSAFTESPLSLFSPNPDLFDSTLAFTSMLVFGFIYAQRHALSILGALDAVTPILATFAIGLALSHLAAGTAFGETTTLPWGIDLWNATRHPTQLYDLLASLLILGLIWFQKPDSPRGILFANFAALTAGSRLFLEAFRGDSALIFGELRLAQIIAWIVLAVALFMHDRLQRSVTDS